MSDVIEGTGFRLRRARVADIPYLAALGRDETVEPFLAGISPWAEAELQAALDAQETDPGGGGRYVIEVSDDDGPRPAGGLGYAVQNRRSRIAYVFGVMVDPSARGRGLAEAATRLLALVLIRDLGYHRVQLEVYGFNGRALALFERCGFVREGVKRKAYWRHGAWHDGVLFGLVEEDLES